MKMSIIDYLIKCYPGFKCLTPERQIYYAESLPFADHYRAYRNALEPYRNDNVPIDVKMLIEFQHKKRLRVESKNKDTILIALNHEISRNEIHEMLNTFCFGNQFLFETEQRFFAASAEYQQIRQYVHRLYSNLEKKYIRIIEDNNAQQGFFSSCRRISPDKIFSNYEKDLVNLRKSICLEVSYFLQAQTLHIERLNQTLNHRYSKKVRQLFHYFPALKKIHLRHYRQRRHFYKTLLLEAERENFFDESMRKENNDLIIKNLAKDCCYILDKFTASLGYLVDLHELNNKHAFDLASIIYNSYLKTNNKDTLKDATLSNFLVNYKKEVIENIWHHETERVFLTLTTCEQELNYTYIEKAAHSLNTMWSSMISSQAGQFAGYFLTRFFDSIGFLQAINTGTENDIALFFVAANAARISEEVGYAKRILIALVRMVFGPIKNELYQASLEPNPSIRELKLAAIILFYAAIIAFAAIALASTAFMTFFVGFEFIAVPIAIVIIIAVATLATKVTFYLMNAYYEWKDYSISQRMRDALGNQVAEEVLMLYKNSMQRVATMIAHLNQKTGLTQQEIDLKVELEKLKIDLKSEWKQIRNDKTFPIDEIKKLIKDRIKYFYDEEKSKFYTRLPNEITHRFEVQQKKLMDFCMQPPNENRVSDPNYKKYIYSQNEVVFFKKRVRKLKNITNHLEESHAARYAIIAR